MDTCTFVGADVQLGRACLLMALIHGAGGVYVLEQPRQSLVNRHPRFRALAKTKTATCLACCTLNSFNCYGMTVEPKVFKSAWWMAHYGSKTAKRHVSWRNSRFIWKFNAGKLNFKKWRQTADPAFSTLHRYRDASGRKRWTGSKKLKQTELLIRRQFGNNS